MTRLDPAELADGLVRIGREAIAHENDAAIDAYFAEDYVFHGPEGDATLDQLKAVFASMRAAWTDFTVERDAIVVQGNVLAARTRMEGIFEHELAISPIGPIPPTGRPVLHQPFGFFRYDEDGRLAEEWANYDNLSLLRQLGIDLAAEHHVGAGAA